MRIPQIQIHTTDLKMDYTITDAQQKITQPKADVQIDQPAAILEISTTNPQMSVDMSQFWKDVNKQSTGETIREHAKKGEQAALSGISKKVSEGHQLMVNAGKGQKGQAIQNIAKQNYGPKQTRIGLDFIPSYNSIKVKIQPGTTDVNITQQKPKIDVQVNKPIHDYTPGEVNGKMVQRPDIEIDVIG